VSRIEEALRLAQPSEIASKAESGQTPFMPAWSVADGTHPPAMQPGQRLAHPVDARPVGFAATWRDRLAMAPDGNPALVEQFRRLAATLHHARQASGLRSVMVTSAMPGDGKTLTAVNLALVLAESYNYNVLLLDADLRRPSIPSVVDAMPGSGLSEALRASKEQRLALVSLTPRLTLLPAGQPISNSIEALTSPRMRAILEEASARFDWVIIDAPPLGPTADARLLTQMVGGTLFVIHAAQTQYADVQKALDAVGTERLLGVVLNGVSEQPRDGYYYGTDDRSAR